MHGGLELVKPNTIWEALFSLEQNEDGEEFWKFTKILNHRTVNNNKIEVEILWDNGETSWKPLSTIRKDDPVTVVEYARVK